ncbi:MAG: serine protein kinase, partial [Patescibacteria group bacterium]
MNSEPTKGQDGLDRFNSKVFKKEYFEEMGFEDYLSRVYAQPSIAYSAHQRLYFSIMYWGVEKHIRANREFSHYKFFEDPIDNGKDAVFGLDKSLMSLVGIFHAAAARDGQERRFLLLRGPVGSSKSTILRLLKKGLIDYTKKEEGKLYSFKWVAETEDDRRIISLAPGEKDACCPLHEEPLRLLPEDVCQKVVQELNELKIKTKDGERERLDTEQIDVEGDLCPFCRFIYSEYLKKYNGNWREVLTKHIRVYRLIFSEADRIGIGSFRPKDEKNQDATELSGDINYRKIAELGRESDPRAFDFSGEFQVANRGILGLEEALKLQNAFLYDFLGATQEHVVKPKRFAESYIDEVIIAATNTPEYEKLRKDEYMEALKDRMSEVEIPYVLNFEKETEIYEKTYRRKKGGVHIGPHTIKMASLWAVLTRIKATSEKTSLKISAIDKAKLYAGRRLKGYNEEAIHDLIAEHNDEGLIGISPRYIQDMIGHAKTYAASHALPCVNWFLVKKFLEEKLANHWSLKTEQINDFTSKLSDAHAEFQSIIKAEVQEAIAFDESDI